MTNELVTRTLVETMNDIKWLNEAQFSYFSQTF